MLNFVAKIDELTFGSIVVEGKKYRRDVLIFSDGMVKKRKGGFLMFGRHKIKKQELEELSQGQPEIIIVGTGTNGAAHIAPEAESWAKGKNLSLLVQPSYDAVAKLNVLAEQKKNVTALIHITC
ncbi:MAG: MTH938/NDUFAF3 family protein [Dehalococcoidia bacterium]|nr:MTH938/NDUFAF3 family protein [Dehalococcoidia bacterium]